MKVVIDTEKFPYSTEQFKGQKEWEEAFAKTHWRSPFFKGHIVRDKGIIYFDIMTYNYISCDIVRYANIRREQEKQVKNDNLHAIRFADSLEKHGKHNEAVSFSEKYPLSKSATAEVKFKWAQHQCAFLSERFDDETVKEIRMDCACGPELGKGKKLKDIYEKERDLCLFVEKVNRLGTGFTLEYDGEFIYLIYPQCYCSCVKRTDTALPITWCYCTLGYTKKMFEYIFEKEVQAELLSSVKQGDDVCKIKIVL